MKRNNGRQTDRQKKKQVSVWWLLGENWSTSKTLTHSFSVLCVPEEDCTEEDQFCTYLIGSLLYSLDNIYSLKKPNDACCKCDTWT